MNYILTNKELFIIIKIEAVLDLTKKGEERMKKFLSMSLVLALVISCVSMISVFAADATRYNENLLTEAQSNFNGQESVPAGWEAFSCDALEIAKDPTDETNDVLRAPGATKTWSSPAIPIGNLIKDEMDKSSVTTATMKITAKVYVKSSSDPFTATDNVVAQMTLRGTEQKYFSNRVVSAESDVWHTIEGTYNVDLSTWDTTFKFCLDSIGSANGDVSDIYVDDVTIILVSEKVPVVEVVNGDAENGTTGWSTFMGGSIEQVSGGANGTANAIKFTPDGEKNEYQTIAFDFGPAIIQDEAKGYAGAGAGEYTISFWAKTDSPKPEITKFKVVLNSKKHVDAKDGKISGIEGDGYVSSYITTSTVVELTDQWQKFEANVTISEAYLKTIKALYDAGNTNAYELVLRLDGASANYAFGTTEALTLFPYYVDEAAIAVAGGEQPGGGDEEVTEVQGVTVKVTSAEEGAGVYVKFDKFAGHLKNGKMTVKIHNTGTSEIKLILEARLNDSKWTTVKVGETVTIAADKVATLTIDCPDKMTSPVDSKEYVPFMLLKIEGAKAGDQFTVYGFTRETMETQKPVSTITTGKASLEYGTTTKACPTGDAAPVAILAIAAAACVMLGLVIAVKKKKEMV